MHDTLYEATASEQQWHWWYVGRRAMIEQSLRQMQLPLAARICEVGCGTGGNLGLLSRYGRLVAIESHPKARALAQGLRICEVYDGLLPHAIDWQAIGGREGEGFDLIAALDVLEHVSDDGAALAELRRGLKPSARCLITVPAQPWLWSIHDEAHHHHRRYQKIELMKRAVDSGFVIERCGFFNSLLFIPISLGRLILHARGQAEKSKLSDHQRLEQASTSPWINGLLRKIFSCESLLVNQLSLRHYFPWGISLMAVLVKRC